jgi:hypothetical protein
MKIFNSKKKFLNIALIVILFVFSFLFKTADAADKWFYWVDTPDNELGVSNGTSGYNTKEQCENGNYKTIGPGHPKSDGCYQGSEIKITDFVLDPGKTGQVGDTLTINGSGIMKVKSILFGQIEAPIYPQTGYSTKVRTEVPQGAKTGKITIKTEYRGIATTLKDFVVIDSPVNTNPWTFLNIQKNYLGPWDTEAECKVARDAYVNDPAYGVIDKNRPCVQRTLEEIKKSRSTDAPTSISAKKNGSGEDVYTLLAPIGNFKEVSTKNGSCPGNPDLENGIGCYLNIIFKIAIGLCGALAVIMIVIAGIEYMGTESIFGKTEAKSKIFSALMGLFIALAAYAILNTINPDLTGKNGVNVDQVEAVIDARDRADDPDFINNIDSLDISNININTSDYSDPSFLGYLAHQQGTAGASAILWAAKNGYSEVPASNPFAKGNILRNMRNNFNSSSAQKTIGTSTLTPANFLKYWAIKVAAAKRKTSPQIPSFIDNELQKASTDTGVDVGQLRTMCRIESAGGCTTQTSITTINKFGYSGLFQLSKAVFSQYAKSGGDILNAYHNAFAAAQFYKFNLNGLNKNWDRINKK